MLRGGWKKILGPVRLKLAFFGTGRADLTNCAKLFEDAANQILWTDDGQVLKMELSMERASGNPRTEVEVEEL